MPTPPRPERAGPIQISLRLDLQQGGRIGPGQIRLLELVDEYGSLRRAADALHMSYPKALKLVKALNETVSDGAVRLAQGGSGGGGATLTRNGRQLVSLYRQIVAASKAENRAAFATLSVLLQRED